MSCRLWAILFGLMSGLAWAAAGACFAKGEFWYAVVYALLGTRVATVIYEAGRESARE